MRDEDKTKEEIIQELQKLRCLVEESEERWILALEGGVDGLWDWNIHTGKIVYPNKNNKEFFGYEEDEAGNHIEDWIEHIYPDDKEKVIRHIEQFLRGENRVRGIEHRILCKDGTYKWIFLKGKIVSWEENGEPLKAMGIFTDTTDRKKAEETLRESESKFKDLAEKSVAGIYLIQDDLFRYVNSMFAEILGYKINEMIDQVGPVDVIYPEDWPIVEENLRKRIAGEVESLHYEFRILTKDQEIRNAEVYSSRTTYKGRPAIIGTLLDITERKRAEELLKRAEEKYHSIFDNAVMGIFQSTPEGFPLNVNLAHARMHGFDSAEEFIKAVSDIKEQLYVDPGDRIKFMEILYKQGIVENFETKQYCKDGSTIWGSIHARAVKDANDKILYYEGTIKDITNRKKAEEKLQRSEAELRALVESMSDVIMVVDKDGRYNKIAAIESDRLLKPANELLIKTFKEVFPERAASFFLKSVRKTLKTNQTVNVEFSLEIKGEERWFSTAVSPLTHESVVCVTRDITNLKTAERMLEAKSITLEETNAALKILLKNMEETKREFEENIVANIKMLVMPYVEKMKKLKPSHIQKTYLDLLETSLKNIASPFLHDLSQFNLTPTETKITNHIKDGKTTKEIMELLCASKDSIDMHRYNIRKKLGINKKKVNFRSYLLSI